MSAVIPDLVYDIGLHRGEDTDYYLTKGYRVVGFEANPRLAGECRTRFRDAIQSERLIVVEGAIAPSEVGDSLDFYVDENSVWGTANKNWADKNKLMGSSNKRITVKRVDITDAYKAYGVPDFIKVDIEGQDKIILESMRSLDVLPRYFSMEAEKDDFSRLEMEIDSLRNFGYVKFRAVQQANNGRQSGSIKTIDGRTVHYAFQDHSSGAFGEDLLSPWMSYEEVLKKYRDIFQLYRIFGDYSVLSKIGPFAKIPKFAFKLLTGYRGGLPGWYDTHASM